MPSSPSRTNCVSYWLTLQPSVTVRSFMATKFAGRLLASAATPNFYQHVFN